MRTALRTTVRHSVYGLLAFPLSLVGFVVTVTLAALGAGLAITVVGLPILALMFSLARGLAYGDRVQLRALLRLDAPMPRYKEVTARGWFGRVTTPFTDAQAWLDVAFQLVRLPFGITSFTLVVTWWAGALGGLTYPLWGWSLPRSAGNTQLPELLGLGSSYLVEVLWYLAIGLFFAVTLRPVMLAAAWVHAGPAVLLLCGRAAMQQEVDAAEADRDAAQARRAAAEASRDAGRTAEHGALRRLERDIHDGPQQQLVRLSLDLARARRQLSEDPDQARRILDEAIGRSGDTLDELRALSRGIAPPLLVDRGLQAALAEITARAPVPVYLEYDVSRELDEHVETGAYFVVSESLTNIAKHSCARSGSVRVTVEPTLHGQELVVSVTDDGVGGAHLAKGSGLAGLADRMRSLGGVLDVFSPAGGPTVVEARIPCG